jgi:hypothetical protein
MKTMHWGALLAGAAIGLGVASPASASYPAGVWVRAQSVTFEPDEANAQRIRIDGAIMLYTGGGNGPYPGYTSPALGYLYYECPQGQEATCKLEWQDIKNSIAKPPEECVGLGDQSIPTGSLRASATPATNPDAYPIAMGVLQGFTPCKVLADFLAAQTPDAGGTGGSGSTGAAGSTGPSGSTGAASTGAGNGTTGSNGAGGSGGSGGGKTPEQDGGCSIQEARSAGLGGAVVSAIGLAAALVLRRARRRR